MLTKTTKDAPSGAHASETFCPYLLRELGDLSTVTSLLDG